MTTNDASQLVRRSVQAEGDVNLTMAGESLVLQLSTFADAIPPFGSDPRRRDIELRKFWPTEPMLASALYSVCIRNAAFSWTLDGPPSTVEATQNILNMADFGHGWLSFIVKMCTDLFSQDNGAFIELIRERDSASAAVIGIAHLDASRCIRTGDVQTPILYTDRKGAIHRLKWYQVQDLTEFPSPVESLNGLQLCAVSRTLRAAQYIRDIGVYNREKISGDNPNAIHLVGGVGRQMISDAMEEHKQTQAEKGFMRYVIPLIIATVDPTATVSHEQIDLKTLPDGFDLEQAMRWYINQLALGFGADYQDFAPLPGSNLGSSAQSLVLHMKSRGRGPAFFMKMFEYAMNFQGLIPQNVTFLYDEQDIAEDTEQAALEKTTAETLEIMIRSGQITPEAATQILFDDGFIDEQLFEEILGGEDVTDDVTVMDTEKLDKAIQDMKRRGRRRKRDSRRSRRIGRPGYASSKQEDNLADFGENVREEIENDFAGEIAEALEDTLDDFRTRLGVAKSRMRLFGRKQEDPNAVFQSPEFWEDFKARAVPIAMSQARIGALKAADFVSTIGLGFNFDTVNQEVLDFSRTYATEWWNRLEGATQNQMRNAIVAWQETGLGVRGFPDLVKALEPTFGRKRANLIATTETTRIFDQGNLIAQRAAGITEQEWQTARDSFVDDEICRPLDGERFPINAGPRPVDDTHVG